MSYGAWLPRCVLCKESVELEQGKADEYGQAVHENCYVTKLTGQTSTHSKTEQCQTRTRDPLQLQQAQ
jgi:hypothetical protein